MSFITKNVEQFAYFDTQLRSPVWRGKNVLDFGGNIGNILHHPNSTIDHDRYWCFDVSIDAIALGKEAAPQANFVFYNRYNFEYNPNGIRNLPLPQTVNKFDFILALSVFTHTSRTEMIETVNHLQGLLNTDGRLAFSFFDPHYIPQGSDVCNLRYYLQQRTNGLSDQELDDLTNRATGARWCTVTNGAVEIEDQGLQRIRGIEEQGHLIFYTPEYLQTIFPHGKMVEPVGSFPRQHCCIINEGHGQ